MAVLYAALSTWLTHVVGRPLVPLNFDRLRYEADFRYGLMRFRDNVEVVTLSRGEALERRSALARFENVMRNWWQLVAAQRRLTVFTGLVGQANGVVPLLVAAPGFFAGLITLGTIAQIRFAYGQVSGALSWFVYAYQEIARWRANVERLSTFTEAMDETEQDLERSNLRVVSAEAPILRLVDLSLEAPDGRVLIDVASATVSAGERVAITGPSGAGKTILLRAIAGIWPFGKGRIDVPARARMLFIPQWPYLPIGPLRIAVSYPAPEGTFPDVRIREVLRLLGLDRLSTRLGRDGGVGSATLAPRAAAPRDRARAPQRARVGVPGQGDFHARRGDGEARLCAACRAVTAHHGDLGGASAGGRCLPRPALEDRTQRGRKSLLGGGVMAPADADLILWRRRDPPYSRPPWCCGSRKRGGSRYRPPSA